MSELFPGSCPPVTIPQFETLPTTLPPNAADFLAALGSPLRWQMVQMLAAGQVLRASDVAKTLGRDFDGVSKHLRLLREAGVVRSKPGEDKRYEWFYIPRLFRAEPAVLNYGWCRFSMTPGKSNSATATVAAP
jgi:predicted transcriptional regulator